MIQKASVILSALLAAALLAPSASAASAGKAGQPHAYADKYLQARKGEGRSGLPAISHELLVKMDGMNLSSDRPFAKGDAGIIKIMEASCPGLDAETAKAFTREIKKWSAKYGLPPQLVAAVISVESSFKPDALSLGNYGAMQVNASSHEVRLQGLGLSPEQLLTIENGVHVGCEILREFLSITGGNYVKALTAYNGAQNPSYAYKVLRMYLYGRG